VTSYVHSRSGKQKLSATSSTDAEVISACEAVKNAVYIRGVLDGLHITSSQPILFYQDNNSAVTMFSGSAQAKRSKHILTKIAYVKDLVTDGILTIYWIGTHLMTADVLTKPLSGQLHHVHVHNLLSGQSLKELHQKRLTTESSIDK
jgi:hypothetical protein